MPDPDGQGAAAMTPIGNGRLLRSGPETYEGRINLAGFDYVLKGAVEMGPSGRELVLRAFYEPLLAHLKIPLIDGEEGADG